MQEYAFQVGLLQVASRKGNIRTERILQCFEANLENTFKTQGCEREAATQGWGITLKGLEFQTVSEKTTRGLRFAAINFRKEEKAMMVGRAVFLDTRGCTAKRTNVKLWSVGFYKGEKDGHLMISKTFMSEHKSFDDIPDIRMEDLDFSGIGKWFHIEEVSRNHLKFHPVEAAEEPGSLAESIVEEEEPVEDVYTVALKKAGITAHACRVEILKTIEKLGEGATRAQVVSDMVENYQWSRGTVYKHLKNLEVKNFLEVAEGQTGVSRELKVLAYSDIFEETIRQICEARGFAFGTRSS